MQFSLGAKGSTLEATPSVDTFRKAGARVVNMSWRYGPGFYEGALAYHNVGKTPEERKAIANRIFEIEKRALEAAIAAALLARVLPGHYSHGYMVVTCRAPRQPN